jgi:hypothetical protein
MLFALSLCTARFYAVRIKLSIAARFYARAVQGLLQYKYNCAHPHLYVYRHSNWIADLSSGIILGATLSRPNVTYANARVWRYNGVSSAFQKKECQSLLLHVSEHVADTTRCKTFLVSHHFLFNSGVGGDFYVHVLFREWAFHNFTCMSQMCKIVYIIEHMYTHYPYIVYLIGIHSYCVNKLW